LVGVSSSRDGMELAVVKARAGTSWLFCKALKIISRAWPLLGGIWMVAVRSPLRTQT